MMMMMNLWMLSLALAWLESQPSCLALTTPSTRFIRQSRTAGTTTSSHISSFLTARECSFSRSSSTQLLSFFDDIFGGNNEADEKNRGGVSSSTQAEINSLQDALFDQTEVLIGLEVAKDELDAVLTKKQNELELAEDEWSQQKTSLVAQIAELTATLTASKNNNREEKDVQEESYEEYQNEKERLEREIRLLKNQQSQVEQRLAVERTKNDALQTKLSKANDSLEFEQMLFFRDKKELQAQVEQQQNQLTELERNLAKEEQQFNVEETNIQNQLEATQQELAASKEEIKRLQREYYQQQDLLKSELRKEERIVRAAQRELENERRQAEKDKQRMENSIEQEKKNLQNMERSIERETQEFEELIKPQLEQTFRDEQANVEELSTKIQREQDRFDIERTSLEDRIAAEKKRLDIVQYQLGRERNENQQILRDLADEQTAIEDQREIDRERMGKRYADLRQAINTRIEQEKRNGRKELSFLKIKYQGTLDDTQTAITELQNQVQLELESNTKMRGMIDDLQGQVQQVYKETKQSEVRYQTLLTERKIEIRGLEEDITELQAIDTQRMDEIDRVESSYRSIAMASLKLTGKRLNRVNPIRLLKRKKNNGRSSSSSSNEMP